ncbi:MAG: TetR/AcrR family transcriptional regulator [Acidiferrobacterales bacterium]
MAESRSPTKQIAAGDDEGPIRKRILDAALEVFTKRGYAQTSTLEIASRARVSKRDLYALVGKKQDMLVACIKERAEKLRLPVGLPPAGNRDALAHTLAGFGAQLLREVSDPTVVSVFRLAISEAKHAPEVARALNSMGRRTSRTALTEILMQALSSRLLDGDAAEMTERFRALLWGDLMVNMLLGVADPPNPREAKQRASKAAAAFLQIYPPASGVKGRR